MKINMQDKYETRDGKPVRVLCVDYKNDRPVLACIKTNNREYVCEFNDEGKYYLENDEHSNDLVLAPKREIKYLPIYADTIFCEKIFAKDIYALAVIEVVFESDVVKSVELCD